MTNGGLTRTDVVASGGTMPTSLTVHDGVLYVLNAGGDGSISGFTTWASRRSPSSSDAFRSSTNPSVKSSSSEPASRRVTDGFHDMRVPTPRGGLGSQPM